MIDDDPTTTTNGCDIVGTRDDGRRRRHRDDDRRPPIRGGRRRRPNLRPSSLSRRRLQYLARTSRITPWYDDDELMRVGRGLLSASDMFPSRRGGGGDDGGEGRDGGGRHRRRSSGRDGTMAMGDEFDDDVVVVGTEGEDDATTRSTMVRRALDRVALWRGRCGGHSIPHAIDSTSSLAGALYADDAIVAISRSTASSTSHSSSTNAATNDRTGTYDADAASPAPRQLRSAYSSAILRSVNGLADSYRRSHASSYGGGGGGMGVGGYMTNASSVSHCCSIAGLPSWIVDVRHDASHGGLPSLSVCRIAATESLNFWRVRYWDGILCGSSSSSFVNDDAIGGGKGIGKAGGNTERAGMCGTRALATEALIGYQRAAMEEQVAAEGKKMRIDDDRKRQHQQHHPKTNGDAFVDVNPTTEAGDVIEPEMKVVGDNEDKEGGEDRDAFVTSNRRGGGAIPWWILNDDDDGKRKKRKKTATTRGPNSDKMVEEGFDRVTNGDNEDCTMTVAMAATRNENECGNDATARASTISKTDQSATMGKKDGNTGGAGSAGGQNHTKSPLTHLPSSSSLSSARERALEFIRTIPFDVAHSTALRFLVWGRPTLRKTVPPSRGDGVVNNEYDEVDDGPALLTLPLDALTSRHYPRTNRPATTLERESYDLSFERLRAMYDPLLIALTTAYPGFLPALFVHMVDSILCLEGARHDVECARVARDGRCRHRRSAGDVDAKGGGGGEEGGCVVEPDYLGDECNETLDLMGLEHRVQYLSRWVRYVLSRAFHMHFDKSVASWCVPEDRGDEVGLKVGQKEQPSQVPSPCESHGERISDGDTRLSQHEERQQQRQRIDLKKRGRKKWTTAQHLYMQCPLDFFYLHDRAGIPLNSVCDRLLHFRQQREDYFLATTSIAKTNATTNTTAVVVQLHKYLEDVIGEKERVIFMGLYDGVENQHEMGRKSPRGSNLIPVNANNDDITQMKNDKEEDKEEAEDEIESSPPSSKRQKVLSLEEMEAIFDDDAYPSVDSTDCAHPPSAHSRLNCEDDDHNTGKTIDDNIPFHVKPWTLCKGWDACAVGTLPGYPS